MAYIDDMKAIIGERTVVSIDSYGAVQDYGDAGWSNGVEIAKSIGIASAALGVPVSLSVGALELVKNTWDYTSPKLIPLAKTGAALGAIGGGVAIYSFHKEWEQSGDLGQVQTSSALGATAGLLVVGAGVAILLAPEVLVAVGAMAIYETLALVVAIASLGFKENDTLQDVFNYWKDTLQQTSDWWADYFNGINSDVNSLWSAFKNWTAPRRDPLVLDLDGDGIETLAINATSNVVFDYDGDGLKTGTGWIKGDDGFVVLDRNGNGTIDNGGELFGDQTLVNGVKATDGFAALSAQDTNANGKFDAGDTNFTNVRIWQDTNADGISQADELHTMSELGITSINLTSTTSNTVSKEVNCEAREATLGCGNVQIAKGTYTKTNGTTGDSGTLGLLDETGVAGNLNFAQNPFYREYTDHLTLTPEAQVLPDMQGSGLVRDLREASTLSAGLTTTLQTMKNTYMTHDEMMAQIDILLGHWAGTSTMATSVNTLNFKNVRSVA